MISINTNPSLIQALQSYRTASSDVQNAIQELATGRRIADPADQIVANSLLVDSNLCMSIGNGLGNDRTVTAAASAATSQIQDTLISLKEAVIASTGENPNTNFAQQKCLATHFISQE